MRSAICVALLAPIVFGTAGAASAQSLGVEVYSGEPNYEYTESAPGAYRYYRSSDQRPVVVIPLRPTNCGEFRYWNGERCLDARILPPDIR